MRHILFMSLCMVVMHSTSAFESSCKEYYAPKMTVPVQVNELCLEGFAVGYSVDGKISGYSTQHLTKDDITFSRMIKRKTSFHEEQRLSNADRASATDFAVSGFDRGHLTPFKDKAYSYDVNSFANVVLQESGLNRGAWMQLEDSIRDEVEIAGSAYVITGTVKSSDYINGLNIPSHMYKVVVFPDKMEYYVAENKKDALVRRVSSDEFATVVKSVSFGE